MLGGNTSYGVEDRAGDLQANLGLIMFSLFILFSVNWRESLLYLS